jgi:hypothetical protein
MADQFSAVGEQMTFISWLDTTNYALGGSTSLANGSASGSLRFQGLQQAGIALPPSRPIAITGDNANLGALLIPGDANPTGQLLTSIYNPTIATKAQGTLVNTVGSFDWTVNGIPCPVFAPFTMIINSPALKQTPGSKGAKGYEVTIWHNVVLQPLDEAQITDAQVHQFTHSLLATYTNIQPWGAPITALLYNTTLALKTGPFWSDYPVTLHSFKGDAAVTTVVLDETPAAATGNAVLAYFAGVKGTYNATPTTNVQYSVDTSTKTVTIGAAPSAGVKVEILYQFLPNC